MKSVRIRDSAGDPYYQQIKDSLRQQIVSGVLKAGASIPHERALAESLQVSRKTTRRAILELTHEGLLRRIRGRGTFVRDSVAPPSVSRGCVLVASQFSPFRSNYYGSILEGVYKAAQQSSTYIAFEYIVQPYDVTLANIQRHGMLKGIVAVGVSDPALLQQFLRLKVPMVLVDSEQPADKPLFDMVTPDAETGMYAAVNYLQELGHKEIVLLSAENVKGSMAGRVSGYRRAMKDARPRALPERIVAASYCPEAAYAATTRILNESNVPTAIVCVGDDFAVGAVEAVKDAGRKVPEDISVAGYGDLGAFTSPRLSTVRVPKEEMGSIAMRLLEMRRAHPASPLQRIVLPVEWVSRGTCGVPRRR